MNKLIKGAGLALAMLFVICLIRVLTLPAAVPAGTAIPAIEFDEAGAVERMAGALRFPTVSQTDRAQIDPRPLDDLAAYLERSFPQVHARLTREKVGQSLLFTWAGSDPAALPLLLLAHLDVVPIEPGTEHNWTHPPFAGVVADGFMWGRGARDDKSSVLALLEAAEWLLAYGFQPPRTVYLAFGHDEEIGGEEGAAKIAALLKSRGIKADLLDEGGAVLEGLVAGVKRPVAAIMAAEKGYFTVRLTTRSEGGHSSRPPPVTAVGRLARAVSRVQQNPMPTRLVAPVTDMMDRLAPEMPLGQRVALANRWLFGPLIRRQMAADQTQNTLVRTTTAPTVIHAGIKDNVLPSEAWALVNFRLLPGDTMDGVMAHLRAVIADDGVELEPEGGFGNNASEPSPIDHGAYRLIERTSREIFPDAVPSTGLVTGATDARRYEGVYETRYNFSPSVITAEDLPTIHGTNERIGVENYLRMVRFYVQLLRNTAGEAVTGP
ncbi:MAG: M20 family peptidase [Gammaproteobacteria bacterium]